MKTDDSFTITTKQQKQITALGASLLQKMTEGERAKSYIDAVIKVRDPSTSLGMTNPVAHTMADRRGRRSLRWHLISIKHFLAIQTFAKQIHNCKRQTENLKNDV